jgi:hypothetical protein
VKSGEGFEAVDLPWFLTLHWAWLPIAEVVVFALRIQFRWMLWPSLDILLLWSFLQAGWLSRVDQRSIAIYWYVGDLALYYASTSGFIQDNLPYLGVVLELTIAVIGIVSLFHFRQDMERYFKDTDDIDLNMSPWTIFFFTPYIFRLNSSVYPSSGAPIP